MSNRAEPEQGAGLRRVMRAAIRLRGELGAGSFYRLLVVAYVVLAAQILGVARYDVGRAAAIVEAAPVSSLLLTVPALALLPVIAYLVITTLVMYIIQKLALLRTRGARSVGILLRVLARVSLLPVLAAAVVLPVGIAIVMALSLAVFLLEGPVNGLLSLTADDKTGKIGYLDGLADSATAITDLWNRSLSAGGADLPPEHAQRLVTQTETAGQRRRIASWYVGMAVVVLLSAFVFARPWMPPRAFVTTEAVPSTCGSLPGSGDSPKVVAGFPLGSSSERLSVLTIDKECVLVLDPALIKSEVICAGNTPWYSRTVLTLIGVDSALPRCATVEREAASHRQAGDRTPDMG